MSSHSSKKCKPNAGATRPHQNRTLHTHRQRDGPRTQTCSQERMCIFVVSGLLSNKTRQKRYRTQKKLEVLLYHFNKLATPSSICSFSKHINHHQPGAEIRRQICRHTKPATYSSTACMHMANGTMVSAFTVLSACVSRAPKSRKAICTVRVEAAGVDLGG